MLFCAMYAVKLDASGSGGGDDSDYLRGAYHLLKNDTFSASSDPDNPTPFVRRTPGYSLFLATIIKALPTLENDDFHWLFPKDGEKIEPSPTVLYIKYIQALLLLSSAFMVAFMVLDLTKSRSKAYFSLWAVGFHPFLERYVNRLYAELYGSFLITTFSFTLYMGLKKRNLAYFVLTGGLLGLLTLTYAQWKYVTCVTLLALLAYSILERKHLAQRLLHIAIMTITWIAIFYPWQIRNLEEFGQPILSAGGGIVLEVRAQYDIMPQSAYWAAFPYWSRAPIFKKALINFVDQEKYIDLIRYEPESVYQKSQEKKRRLMAIHGLVETDTIMKKEALGTIKANPVRHLLMSIPIGFRLMMNPVFSVLYVGVYVLFCYAFIASIKYRQWLLPTVLASTMGLFGFNMLATHGLARYNEVASQILIFGAIVGWDHWKKNPKRTHIQ